MKVKLIGARKREREGTATASDFKLFKSRLVKRYEADQNTPAKPE